MKLTNIELQNFKSHEKTQIRPKLITILIGPNSSGKSSVLQSLMMLKSSLKPQGGQEPPITKKESFDLGEFEDILTHNEEKTTFSIKIDGQYPPGDVIISKHNPLSEFSYFVEFSKSGKKQLNLKSNYKIIKSLTIKELRKIKLDLISAQLF